MLPNREFSPSVREVPSLYPGPTILGPLTSRVFRANFTTAL